MRAALHHGNGPLGELGGICLESTFDADAFVRRIGERLVEQFNDARAATSPATVGEAMEQPMKDQLEQVLPRGIGVGSGFVIDSYGGTSRQTDIVLYEKDICPIFSINGTPATTYYPCECVIASGKSRAVWTARRSKMHSRRSLRSSGFSATRCFTRYPCLTRAGAFPSTVTTETFRETPHTMRTRHPATERGVGFVLGGDIRIKRDTLMLSFLALAQEVGDRLSPNLLVTLDGITFYWGKVTKERPGRLSPATTASTPFESGMMDLRLGGPAGRRSRNAPGQHRRG